MLYKEFYSELGKLLYAVADIDGAITPKEKKALYEIVKKELAPGERHKDEFGTNAARYAEMEFDYLEEETAGAEDAFRSFIDFVKEHRTAFDEKLKKASLRVATELANVYRKTNRKEKVLLKELKKHIDNLTVIQPAS